MADEKLVEYIDWSDRGFEKHEAGEGASKYAVLDFWREDGSLIINLRRSTEKRRDFTILVDHHTEEIYKMLREHFGEK